MSFLIFNNADIQFVEKELIWRSYTAKEALPTTWKIVLIDKKEFFKAALDKNIEIFMIHVSSLSLESKMTIHLAQEAQIALLLAKKVTVPTEYSDFANIFSKESTEVLPESTGINKCAIKLEDGKWPPYGSIYILGPVKLETWKTYIEINLVNGFIQSAKSLASTPILFVCKPNVNVWLWVDYQGLNNLTIKNRYLLLLIDESLDWLGQAKCFTQLDLTSAYYCMRIKEGNEWKTAFKTQYSHFKYQVMSFRLSNAPASF